MFSQNSHYSGEKADELWKPSFLQTTIGVESDCLYHYQNYL